MKANDVLALKMAAEKQSEQMTNDKRVRQMLSKEAFVSMCLAAKAKRQREDNQNA